MINCDNSTAGSLDHRENGDMKYLKCHSLEDLWQWRRYDSVLNGFKTKCFDVKMLKQLVFREIILTHFISDFLGAFCSEKKILDLSLG